MERFFVLLILILGAAVLLIMFADSLIQYHKKEKALATTSMKTLCACVLGDMGYGILSAQACAMEFLNRIMDILQKGEEWDAELMPAVVRAALSPKLGGQWQAFYIMQITPACKEELQRIAESGSMENRLLAQRALAGTICPGNWHFYRRPARE